MGYWRFRRSFGPKGLKLNVSKTGFSITGGVPGAHVNADLSGRRKRPFINTFGLPGTGLSYRTDSYGPKRGSVGNNESVGITVTAVTMIIIAAFIISWLIG